MKIKLKKGLDIKLEGAVEAFSPVEVAPELCAVSPEDFPGFMPKVDVKEGDNVFVGTALMHDKNDDATCLVSPVSGTVTAVERGERRKVLKIVVKPDGKQQAVGFDLSTPLMQLLANSGLLALMRRRPYDIVPNSNIRPRDIFVTAIDTAPLAISPLMQLGAKPEEYLTKAVKALKTVTSGKVYICHGADWKYGQIADAEMVEVEGCHPAGNVGVQIANIAPVNKGEDVLAMDVATLYRVGRLLTEGNVYFTVNVALTGPEVATPSVIRSVAGSDIKSLVAGRLKSENHHIRIISGNVLTGTAVDIDGFLHNPYRQVTVIAEGDDVDEFMGWASIAPSKLSASRTLPLHGLRKLFSPDARLLGGRRAMIMSGEYDKVLPMDIMAEYLIKAIVSRNIEDMEGLGIYEVAPEDFALCEFVDTSKMPLQQIVREGLDYIRKELE